MKHKHFFCLLIAACISIQASAQDNIVKLGLGTLWFGNIKPSYERVLNDKSSVQLTVGVQVPRSLNKLADRILTDPEPDDFMVDESKFNGIAIIGQYRFYPKGQAPKGFYLAPFVKYAKYSLSLTDNIPAGTGDVDGNWRSIGGGLQFGTQWVIKDKITIDFEFLGLAVNKYDIDAFYTTDDPLEDYQETEQDAIDALLDIPVIDDKFTTRSDSNSASGEISFTYVAYRGVLSIGYAF